MALKARAGAKSRAIDMGKIPFISNIGKYFLYISILISQELTW